MGVVARLEAAHRGEIDLDREIAEARDIEGPARGAASAGMVGIGAGCSIGVRNDPAVGGQQERSPVRGVEQSLGREHLVGALMSIETLSSNPDLLPVELQISPQSLQLIFDRTHVGSHSSCRLTA